MLSRRDFLRSCTFAIGSAAASPFSFAAAAPAIHVGAQLYTVRKEAEADLPGILRQIRAIGYDEVETYWNVYSHSAKDLRTMIVDAGLRVPSGHFDYTGLADKFDYAKELGVEFMVCPMLPPEMRTLDGFQRAAEQFNRWGENAHSMNMRFAFHNHNYEFERFGETTGFETLVARTDPKLVFFEMDCYWIAEAGEDPVAIMQKLGKRIRLLHLKDRKRGFPPSHQKDKAAEHFTELGNGSLGWQKILNAARENNVEHMFVEQDECDRPPIESLRISYRHLIDLLRLEELGVIS